MKGQLGVILITMLMFSWCISSCMPTNESMRIALENTWNQYLKASQSGIESELEKVMSSYRFITMKNNLASSNRTFSPEMIKSIAQYAPDITKARFVKLIEKGPTAGLVYETDIDEKDASGEERINFIFIKFVKEESGWKVDGGMEIGSPKFNEDGTKSTFNSTELPPSFEIDGKILRSPSLITIPEIIGMIEIFSPGFNVKVTLNGNVEADTKSNTYSGILKGGIKIGNNNIAISVLETENDPSFKPTVTVKRILADKTAEVVFKFEPKENILGKHEFNFSIEN